MDINEVSRRTGIPASTLRYYDERGLIRSVGRRGLRRLFDAGVLQRLALIALGRSAGFSLDEIARMFAPDGGPRIDRGLLAEKAGELDATIRRLTAMRDGLKHAAACPAPSHMECPTFRRLLAVAAEGSKSQMKQTRIAGYSGVPLASKLGFKPASRVFLIGAPSEYRSLVGSLPEGVVFARKLEPNTDFVHLFATRRSELQAELTVLRRKLKAEAAVWVSWPKKSSRVPTDITEDTIREVALPMGFVDIKVCAVNEVWSGLKLVIRKELR